MNDTIEFFVELFDGAREVNAGETFSKGREFFRKYLQKEFTKQNVGPRTQRAMKGLIVFPIADAVIDQLGIDPGAEVRNAIGDRGGAMVGPRVGGDLLPPENQPAASDDGPQPPAGDVLQSGIFDP